MQLVRKVLQLLTPFSVILSLFRSVRHLHIRWMVWWCSLWEAWELMQASIMSIVVPMIAEKPSDYGVLVVCSSILPVCHWFWRVHILMVPIVLVTLL